VFEQEVLMMRPRIGWAEVTLDCCDTARAAEFWSRVLDLPARSQSMEGWYQLGPADAGGPVINMQPVVEEKVGKSRVHLDLWVDDFASAQLFIEGCGGKQIDVHRHDEWMIGVMADPEGIEFCIVGAVHNQTSRPSG
jgi:predicted enzyme related to lactoylglutathione lyase